MAGVYLTCPAKASSAIPTKTEKSSVPVWKRYGSRGGEPDYSDFDWERDRCARCDSPDTHQPFPLDVINYWFTYNKGTPELLNSILEGYSAGTDTAFDYAIGTLATLIERQYQELDELLAWASRSFQRLDLPGIEVSQEWIDKTFKRGQCSQRFIEWSGPGCKSGCPLMGRESTKVDARESCESGTAPIVGTIEQ
ncbi:MAG: hypothetical protein AB1646_11780 [Thermodesulfobacteriota bacterium]